MFEGIVQRRILGEVRNMQYHYSLMTDEHNY